jgi:hypothetical protein
MDLPIARITVVECRQGPDSRPSAVPVLIDAVKHALDASLNDVVTMDPEVLAIPGMSGRRYRCLINALVRKVTCARYLEIGSWAGSTLCSAINSNAVMATAIDNWSEFGGPKEDFLANLKRFQTPRAYVNFIEQDYRQVDYTALGSFNIYLFDGPHLEEDHYDGLRLVEPALDETFILIVDDWNWTKVRDGTEKAIVACHLVEHFKIEIRPTLDDSHSTVAGRESDWHNGYYIGVLTRTGR